MVGREFLQKRNSENQGINLSETITEKTQFEVEFPTMDTSSSEETTTEISNCHLTHDKVRRVIVASQRDDYANLGYYVFNVAEGLQNKRRKPSGRHLKTGGVKSGRKIILVGLLNYLGRKG